MTSTASSPSSALAKNSLRIASALAVLILGTSVWSGCGRAGVEPPAPTAPPPAEIWKEFSGENAFQQLQHQVKLGPRPAGSSTLASAQKLIIEELAKYGWNVTPQSFTKMTGSGPIKFTNLVAHYGQPDKTERFLIATHYDTKAFDTIPFVGANDGASGVGTLIELARVLAMDPSLANQVELVFFDGKDALIQPSDTDGLFGSRYFAQNLKDKDRAKQIKAAIVVDLIGGKDLAIAFPYDSSRDLAEAFQAAATQLNVGHLFTFSNRPVWDDHVPLIQAGVPTLGVIDQTYTFRHTADDTPDKLSPDSLKTVGETVLHWLKGAATQP